MADIDWTAGDTVDVKITRKAATPVTVPDGHPVIWQADISTGSNSAGSRTGWNANDDYGSLNDPADFEYKDGSYEATSVYSTSNNVGTNA